MAGVAAIFTLLLPAVADAAQKPDSVAVIERGTDGVEGWDVIEFPFRVLTLPLSAAGWGVVALIGVAERGHWVPWLAYYNRQLTERGIHVSLGGQGSNSGSGGELLLGIEPRAGSAWANVRGGATVKGYWRTRAEIGVGALDATRTAGSAVGLRAFGSVEHRAEDEFFGIGRRSVEAGRSDYELDRYSAGAELGIAPIDGLEVGIRGSWDRSDAGRGSDDRRPDVDLAFSREAIPGFGRREDYLSIGAAATWRSGHPHAIERGGRWASVGYRWNASDTEGAADFGRLSGSAGIDLPFDYRIRSVALAVYYESLRPAGAGEIAFYNLPTLGGTDLPSYRADRFRDRDLLLGQAEYRFRLWDDPRGRAALDASFFLYGGMVARNLSSEFRFDRLRESYGIRLSLLDETSRLAQLLLALGGERTQLLLDFRLGS